MASKMEDELNLLKQEYENLCLLWASDIKALSDDPNFQALSAKGKKLINKLASKYAVLMQDRLDKIEEMEKLINKDK